MTLAELYGKPPSVSDDQARRTIEFCCPVTMRGYTEWHDMEAVANLNLDDVTDAFRWLKDRGDKTPNFAVICDPKHPNLIRFGARQDSGYASQLHVV